jgi:hypothetical protein
LPKLYYHLTLGTARGLEGCFMKPILHVASDPNDPVLKELAACIGSIECAEHFVDNLGKTQREQALVVRRFQNALTVTLAAALPQMRWSQEHRGTSGGGDKIDILGANGDALVVIELDKNRADQVAKKFVSRSAIFLDKRMHYISLCYPGTERMNVSECIKYFGYCARLAKRLENVYAGFVIPQP